MKKLKKGSPEEQTIRQIANALPSLPITVKGADGKYHIRKLSIGMTGAQLKEQMPDMKKVEGKPIKDNKRYVAAGAQYDPKGMNHYKNLTKAFKKKGVDGVEEYKNQVYNILENLVIPEDLKKHQDAQKESV